MRAVSSVWLCGVLAWTGVVGCSFDSSGFPWVPRETDCANGVDDDGDSLTDCADSDCDSHPACSSNSNNTNSNSNNSPGPEYCTNAVDDDLDGLTDCADPDCSAAPSCLVEDCANDMDDDQDGLTDCDDPDCSGAPVCVPEDGTNHVDDDLDGAIDCDDSDCVNAVNCAVESCASGVDDDLDGLIDCDDPDCLGTSECGACHPITNAGCGAGTNCYLDPSLDWFGVCQPVNGGGGQWAYCDSLSDCQQGYYCSGAYYACLRVCHPGSSDCDSATGTSCRAFADYNGSSSPWGACAW